MISVKVIGIAEVVRALDKASKDRQARVSKVLSKTGLNVVSTARKSMRDSPATGVTYKKSGSVSHTASSKDNAPRIDTGTLSNSVKMVREKNDVLVGTNKKYGRYLEFGTVNMDARPWLFPALEQNNPKFLADLKEALK